MPEKKTRQRARADKKRGNAPSTQAGEYVREEIHHVREGKHGAKNAKQAIAIGLSKARRDGVKVAPKKKSAAKKTTAKKFASRSKSASHTHRAASTKRGASAKRSAASKRALKRQPKSAASHKALSRQAKSAARERK